VVVNGTGDEEARHGESIGADRAVREQYDVCAALDRLGGLTPDIGDGVGE